MKLKTVTVDGKTYAEVQDGKPVFVHDDGSEVAFDAPGTRTTITRLNGEAKTHREAKEAAEARLAAFKDIADPAAAIKALDTVSKLDQKKLLEAGQVDQAILAALKPVQDQLAAATKRGDEANSALENALIGGAFKGSKFIADKVAIPPHLLQNTFGKQFKVEDGKVVPYGTDGQKIFSRIKPGEVAEFDEALDIIVSADPYKDHILKGTGNGGGGAKGSPGAPGGKTITRADFEKLSPADRQAKVKEVTIVDA